MLAKRIMAENPATIHPETQVKEAFAIMRESKSSMLPVVDGQGRICGELTTYDLLQHIGPEYIASGDLTDVSFAPDIGVLRKHFQSVMNMRVAEVMGDAPLLVKGDESLLAVTVDLITARGRHEYALVVDDEHHLLGVISPRDILERLRRLKLDEAHEND